MGVFRVVVRARRTVDFAVVAFAAGVFVPVLVPGALVTGALAAFTGSGLSRTRGAWPSACFTSR